MLILIIIFVLTFDHQHCQLATNTLCFCKRFTLYFYSYFAQVLQATSRASQTTTHNNKSYNNNIFNNNNNPHNNNNNRSESLRVMKWSASEAVPKLHRCCHQPPGPRKQQTTQSRPPSVDNRNQGKALLTSEAYAKCMLFSFEHAYICIAVLITKGNVWQGVEWHGR